MAISTKEFTDFLVRMQPHYDQEILKDIRPSKEKFTRKIPLTDYEITLYSVRKLSEGLAFERVKLKTETVSEEDLWLGSVNCGAFDQFTTAEHTLDRFNAVFPKIAWP